MDNSKETKLRWADLPEVPRAALAHKLAGLYGHDTDQSAFDVLALDKQQALLLFVGRLRDLDLWQLVEQVENVYGEGGVGMDFRAHPELASTLSGRKNLSTRFAVHRDCAEGFVEIRRARAALHFLRMTADAHRWSVHFDLHAPMATTLSALRHLWHEKLRGVTPDWRAITTALGDVGRSVADKNAING